MWGTAKLAVGLFFNVLAHKRIPLRQILILPQTLKIWQMNLDRIFIGIIFLFYVHAVMQMFLLCYSKCFIIRNIRTVIYWHHEYFHTVIPMVFYCHCERLPIVIPTILHCHSERQWEISLPSMRFFGNFVSF